MSPDMQARTLVEYAMDNCTKAYLDKHVPAGRNVTDTQLRDLAAEAMADMRAAVATASRLLGGG